ncbi:MAG: hypothetical protein ACI3V1_01980 [Faecousia sp.]
MPNTVPNQKVVHVHRDMPDKNKKEGNFLLIKKENWYAANKDLEPYGLQLYLYIAGNRDGFDFALSQEAAERDAGITKTTFHKYVKVLIEKGYLVPRKENSNIYDFYEVPKRKEDKEAVSPCELNSLPDGNDDLRGRLVTSQGNKEIYNNTDNLIDKNINRAEFVF